jgi:hypothetical protein
MSLEVQQERKYATEFLDYQGHQINKGHGVIVFRHIAILVELNCTPRVHTVSSHNLMMLCFFRWFSVYRFFTGF